MRIGIVCPYSWDVPGGVQFHIRDLAEHLIRCGHEVSVLAPADDGTPLPPFVVSAGRAVPVPYNGSVARLNFGFLSAARVRRWLHDGDFDVIHIHEPTSPSLGLLACWAAQGPIVATFHTSNPRSRAMIAAYPILQPALEKISARIAVSEYARRTLVEHLGGDAVVIPNGVDVDFFARAEPRPEWTGVGTGAGTGAHGSTGEDGRTGVLPAPGTPPASVAPPIPGAAAPGDDAGPSIPEPGAPLSAAVLSGEPDSGARGTGGPGPRPLPDAPSPDPGRPATIGFIGRIDEPRKGLPVLMRALPKILAERPGTRLLVAGRGDEEEAVAALPSEARDAVEFLGMISDEDKARLLRSVDLYVAPNTGGESFGIILVEAMSAGAPVLASDLDAFAQVLDRGAAGELFANEDADALAAAAVRLLADPARRAELSERGSRHVRRFDWSTVGADILAVYETVTTGAASVATDERTGLRARLGLARD
ncbi:glycosyltransferase family 4 protein [Streptomyces sp. CA-181903]|uniref:glycosyltransferase family 4 protein n=1 Tax=Streptomyces sp. CA-181903 TaxID=3240055 RepID=UPI003D9103B2